MATFFSSNQTPRAASIGRVVSGNAYRVNTKTRGVDPSATRQSGTVDIGSVGNETLYTFSAYIDQLGDTLTASYTSDSDATAAEVRDGLLLDMQGNAALMGVMDVVIDGADLDYTFAEGITATVTVSGTGVVIANAVAASDFPTFLPGRFVGVIAGGAGAGLGTHELVKAIGAAEPMIALVVDAQEASVAGAGVLTADPSGAMDGGIVYAVQHPGSAVTVGGAVYVEYDATADRGRPFTSSSGTRIQLADASWVGVDPADPSIAWLRF